MTMVEERLTDQERHRLLGLAIAAVPHDRGDPELTQLIAKLSGVDTEVLVRRAYPSPMTIDAEARELLRQIRDLALSKYHQWRNATLEDPDLPLALGFISGIADRVLEDDGTVGRWLERAMREEQ